MTFPQCGTYVLLVWFTLLIGFDSVWIFSYPSRVKVTVRVARQDDRIDVAHKIAITVHELEASSTSK